MNYDFSISGDVSLSKILDVFLLDNEDPNVVIEFLKQHDDTLEEILNKSICVGKIFQYSFFKKLNFTSKYFFDKNILPIKSLENYCKILCWQLCAIDKNSYVTFYRNWVIDHNSNMNHPYTAGHGKYVYELDNLIIKHLQNNDDPDIFISEIINEIDYNNPGSIKFEYSLFISAILQYNVFSQLSYQWKFLFLNNLLQKLIAANNYYDNFLVDCVIRFIEQLLEFEQDNIFHDAILNAVKIAFCSQYLEYYLLDYTTTFLNSNFQRHVFEDSCIEEFLINSTLEGVSISPHEVLYLLGTKKSWIKNWYKNNPEELDNILAISKYFKNVKYKKAS